MTNLILKSLSRLHKDEAGQGLVEYALILALVAFAAVVAMQTLAKDINNAFTGIGPCSAVRPVVAWHTNVSVFPVLLCYLFKHGSTGKRDPDRDDDGISD